MKSSSFRRSFLLFREQMAKKRDSARCHSLAREISQIGKKNIRWRIMAPKPVHEDSYSSKYPCYREKWSNMRSTVANCSRWIRPTIFEIAAEPRQTMADNWGDFSERSIVEAHRQILRQFVQFSLCNWDILLTNGRIDPGIRKVSGTEWITFGLSGGSRDEIDGSRYRMNSCFIQIRSIVDLNWISIVALKSKMPPPRLLCNFVQTIGTHKKRRFGDRSLRILSLILWKNWRPPLVGD
jgi:hypothetical protein